MAIDTYALTTLVNAKSFLHETTTDQDTLLTELINRASDIIEAYVGRRILTRSYAHRFDGDDNTSVFLAEYPVTAVARLAVGVDDGLAVTCTSTTAHRATVEVSTTTLTAIITGGGDAGSDAATFVTNTTLDDMVTAIGAFGKGWSATAISRTNPVGSADLFVVSPQNALNQAALLPIPATEVVGYTLDGPAGFIRGPWFFRGVRNIYCEYTAGESAVPNDIESVAVEVVSSLFHGSLTDRSVQGEMLGDYRVNVGTDENRADYLDSGMRDRLEPHMNYRRVSAITT